jgi:hypothetical protein
VWRRSHRLRNVRHGYSITAGRDERHVHRKESDLYCLTRRLTDAPAHWIVPSVRLAGVEPLLLLPRARGARAPRSTSTGRRRPYSPLSSRWAACIRAQMLVVPSGRTAHGKEEIPWITIRVPMKF